MSIIQGFIIVFALFAITRTILQFQKGAVTRAWLLFWILFWIASAVVAALPQTADTVARIVGVGRGADVVIYASLIAIFYLIFRLYVKIEQVEGEITRLVRKLAVDEVEKNQKD
jgi:small membrane protein